MKSILVFLMPALIAAAATDSKAPPPLACPAGAVFTPFSLVPPAKLPAGARPMAGRIVRLDYCSDETAGTLQFRRLVIREMKVKNRREVASYIVIIPEAGDIASGLETAPFGDTSALQLTVHTDGNQGFELRGAADAGSVTFAHGTFHNDKFAPEAPLLASLEQEDRIAIAEGACGAQSQLERAVFQVGTFRLQSEACRLTRQFGSRYTFRKLTVDAPPDAARVLQTPAELAELEYRYTQHNANDGWTLALGDRSYEFVITDDLELVGETPTEVKFFRVKQGAHVVRETRIVAPTCGPLSCHWNQKGTKP